MGCIPLAVDNEVKIMAYDFKKFFKHNFTGKDGRYWHCVARSARKDLAQRDAKIFRENYRVKIIKKVKYYYVFVNWRG